MESLIKNIKDTTEDLNLSFRLLQPGEANKLIKNLGSGFQFDFNKLYMWELNDFNKKIIEYKEDWSNHLEYLLIYFQDFIYLTITDDEFYPWPVFFGKKSDLIKLLEEQQFFEYFIFDEKLNEVLFDTHHNAFYHIKC